MSTGKDTALLSALKDGVSAP